MVFNFASDARAFTDYNTSCSVDQRMMKQNKVSGSGYRHYLQKNAEAIMKANRKSSIPRV